MRCYQWIIFVLFENGNYYNNVYSIDSEAVLDCAGHPLISNNVNGKYQCTSLGLDSVHPMSVQMFDCLTRLSHTCCHIFIGRLWMSNGSIDSVGADSIANAFQAGYQTHAYICPCTNANCDSASVQMTKLDDYIIKNSLFNSIRILWIQIEPGGCWASTNISFNRIFIEHMVQKSDSLGYRVGIFTNEESWTIVFGEEYEKLSDRALWWLGNGPGTKGFRPFANWTSQDISLQQYAQIGQASNCSNSSAEIGLNWQSKLVFL